MASAPHQHPEDELLFLAAQVSLLQGDVSRISGAITRVTDWDRFLHRAFETNLAPLAHACFRTVDTSGIPAQVLSSLQTYHRKVVAHNMVLYHELEQVVQLLNAAQIDFIPLKGMMLAEVIYGDIGLRQISDIDLLVRTRDIEACREVLVEAAWSCKALISVSAHQGDEFFKHAHPYLFHKSGVSLELHQHIHNGWMDYSIDIDDYWQRATSSPFLNGQAYLLNPSDLLQHLCIHFYKHLNGAQIKVSTLFDIPAVICHYQHRIDWANLRTTSLQYGCLKQLQSVLHLAGVYCGLVVPSISFEDYDQRDQHYSIRLFTQRITDPYGTKNKGLIMLQLATAKRGTGRLTFMMATLFPSKSYMINRYKIKHPALVFIFYPARLCKGFVRWFSFIRYKLNKKFS